MLHRAGRAFRSGTEHSEIAIECRAAAMPPALRVPGAIPASSNEEERKESRDARFRILASEDVEQALISFAIGESKANQNIEMKPKECDQADVEGGELDDDLRPIARNMAPQGIAAFEDVSPLGSDEVATSDVVVHSLWKAQFTRGNVGEHGEGQAATACPQVGLQVVPVRGAAGHKHLSRERWLHCHFGVPKRVANWNWRRLWQTTCAEWHRAHRDVEDGEQEVAAPRVFCQRG